MSNTNIIECDIKSFILNPTARVLVIKGKWGIGKTHTWDKCLQECSKSDRPDKYAYVTLFGLNSIQDIKKSIFENTISKKDKETEPSIDTLMNKVTPSIKKFTSLSKGIKIPYFSNMSGAVDLISEYFIKDQLICIDDLERRGKGLEIKDVLGLVSLLKEKKNCKIVLIYNDGEEGLEDVEKYNEKVISQELVFNPSTEECFDVIFNNCKYKDFVWADTQELKIQNIRVLGKIKYFVDKILAEIPNYDKELKQFAVSMIVLHCWSYYYRQSDNAISFEYLKLGWRAKKERRDASKDNPEQLKNYEYWDLLLSSYGFLESTTLVEAIRSTIENGYIPASFIDAADEHQKSLRKEKKKVRLQGFWRNSVWGCLDADEEKVLKELEAIFLSELEYLVPRDIQDILQLLVSVDGSESADNTELSKWYISKYIEQNRDNPQMYNSKNLDMFFRAPNGLLREMFDEEFSKYMGRPNAKAILTKFDNMINLTEEDAKVLEGTSDDDWKTIFLSEGGRENAQHLLGAPMVTKATKDTILKILSGIFRSNNLAHFVYKESFPNHYEEIVRLREESLELES